MNTEIILSSDEIKSMALELGADEVGITYAAPVKTADRYLKWLRKDYAADMDYLKRNVDLRLDPTKLLPGARSIVVIGLNYYPTDDHISTAETTYKVARYAWGEDYHTVIRRILKKLRGRLKTKFPKLSGRICVDSAPFMDKYWAEQASLGWQGKHSNLVSKNFGSWLLIGSLVLDADCDNYEKPHSNHCGRCTACIEACPTGAIVEPYLVDARKCISYWTIESKAPTLPDFIKANLNNYLFGCDICLEVCPFNKFQKPANENLFKRTEIVSIMESGAIDNISDDRITKLCALSAINRASPDSLKRNIKSLKSSRQISSK